MEGRYLVAACLALLVASAAAAPARNPKDCMDASLLKAGMTAYPAGRQIQSSSVSVFPDHTTVQVATNFNISYYGSFKVVRNTAKSASEAYILYQCGTSRPDPAELGLPADTKAFAVPLAAVSVSDTSVVNFMKLLSVQDRVSYVTKYVVDSCLQSLAAAPCNRTDGETDDSLIDARFGFGTNTKDPLAISFAATSDPGPLNRAEYIKYLAAFFNREEAANAAFANIVAAYNKYKAVGSAQAAAAGSAPLVAWVYYREEQKRKSDDQPRTAWAEQVQLYFTPFRKTFSEDAGGRLHDPQELLARYGDGESIMFSGTSLYFFNLNTTMPVLRSILADVDMVIDETYYAKLPTDVTLDDFRKTFQMTDAEALTQLKFMRGQALLRLDGSATPLGSTAWFEEAVARPDEVLRNLVAALHPTALAAANADASPPRLVRSMFATPRVVLSLASQCPLQSCRLPQTPICPALFKDCRGNIVQATDATQCAPDCPAVAGGSNGGAANRAAVAPAMLMLFLTIAVAIVKGWVA